MEPTLLKGDLILVSSRPRTILQGDVVIFKSPINGTKCIKRVMGLPGKVVRLFDGSSLRVPEGSYFVTGDAPDGPTRKSLDSRFFGPIRQTLIHGHALRVLASINDKNRNNILIR
jgi:signal peptidase I